MAAARILIDQDPFIEDHTSWVDRCHWPAHWISVADAPATPVVAGYRLAFAVDAATEALIHVSADERYELYLDGQLIGRGPDRGDLDHWNFESYRLDLPAGDHLLAARVWSIGAEAPYAQFSLAHGFLVAAEGRPELTTGTGAWQAAVLPGHGTRPKGPAWGCGLKCELDGRIFPWGWERGEDQLDWAAAVEVGRAYSADYANDVPPTRLLVPAILPAQAESEVGGARVRLVTEYAGGPTTGIAVRTADGLADEVDGWQRLLAGEPLTVPARTSRRVLLDLENYVCAYPRLTLRGGRDATVDLNWQEALLEPDGRKGHRDEIEGKFFRSPGRAAEQDPVGDRFIAGGGERESFSTLWWEAGRYVEVLVQTGDTELTLTELGFTETLYPYQDLSHFDSDDDRLERVKRLGFRTLQMCSHETTMDCPFYEQLQYAGDTRIQCLVGYLATGDDRLARQALLAFDRSRSPRGLTTSRYPSRIRQTIPPFSLWWIAMVHDFALWRGDLEFVRTLMPGVRAVLDAHRTQVGPDGVFSTLDGWNFMDWVDGWNSGTPPGAQWGVSGVANLQLVHVADLAADLESWIGEPELAGRHSDLADLVRAAAERTFWSAERGLYADDPEHQHWSEHAQSLAVLAGAEHGPAALERTLITDGLDRTTVYFDHYLFEALGRIGRTDVIHDRLGLWFGLLDQGLRTVIEQPEPTRSDCHAWGAHPIFHLYATLLGVRPTSPGMSTVSITPRLGRLTRADGTLQTPHGPLRVSVDGSKINTELPAGISLDAAPVP
ncbi:family 78 glycoside hydrolase catalytic domain [Microlunatus speluncae]|uniref:alpha-L-rhamnosidase-related protein n=1 Tax=Microlunatus speluncae TaxID=2594267 RepID=UPI0012660A66|nr:family 78 glycoside hydrolase catalytic domain [Microlunatus speluncae]